MLFRLLPCLALFLLPVAGHAQRIRLDPGHEKPVLYDDVTKGVTDDDRVVEEIYAKKFRFVEATTKEGLVNARIKGEWTGISDPRSIRSRSIPAKVTYSFVVTPEGKVTEPRILEATDPRIAQAALEAFASRRFVAAQFRGVPVASVYLIKQKFGGEKSSDSGYSNGLGIQGYRDR